MTKELYQYDFPEDLKTMDIRQLELLACGIRDFLIDKVSKTGGHLASNLGVVELTIALHKVFESPRDKIIWDVGHQSYVHKILTGRSKDFDRLRQMGGISGFPKTKESEHDVYETGHSSTSVSAAAGLAAARDLRGEDYEVVAVIGDGSMTGGMAFEALNNLGTLKSKVIVVLNDNGMSISRNIGGLSQHLSKLRTSDSYLKAKKAIKKTIRRIPRIGEDVSAGLGHMKDRVKYALLSGGVIFEELGFTYLGPVDGHNLSELLDVMEVARHVSGPVMIHVITQKGKGYRTAEKNPNKFHGIGPFDPETGIVKEKSSLTYSKVFGETMAALGEEHSDLVAVSAAMCDATGLRAFADKYPDRFYDVGIAEAHGVTFAAGLARAGIKPVAAIYSSFLQRGYDQLIEDVCLQNLPVVFAIDRAGIVGADGETHHGIFDLSYLRTMPNMTVLTPASGGQLVSLLRYALKLNSPAAIRYPRGGCTLDEAEAEKEFDGKNQRLADGRHLDIWAVGPMKDTAVKVRNLLAERNIDAGVVCVMQVKPLELSCLKQDLPMVTLEDNLLAGGFGEGISACTGACVLRFGWPDQFIEHGSCEELYRKYGLDAETITERICEYLERKA